MFKILKSMSSYQKMKNPYLCISRSYKFVGDYIRHGETISSLENLLCANFVIHHTGSSPFLIKLIIC